MAHLVNFDYDIIIIFPATPFAMVMEDDIEDDVAFKL